MAAAGFEDSDSCGWPARAVPSGRPGSAAAESARSGVEPGERSPHLPFPPSQAAVPDRAVKCHVVMVPNSGWGSYGICVSTCIRD
jgi:hypothetical protein